MSAYNSQAKFLREVDAYNADAETRNPTSSCESRPKTWDRHLSSFITELPTVAPSATIVMEIAFKFVQSGLMNIPDTSCINVKAARAFLFPAQRLQEYMSLKWVGDGVLDVDAPARLRESQQVLIIIGPGGTGKTTVLRIAEALIDFCCRARVSAEMCYLQHCGAIAQRRQSPRIVQTTDGKSATKYGQTFLCSFEET